MLQRYPPINLVLRFLTSLTYFTKCLNPKTGSSSGDSHMSFIEVSCNHFELFFSHRSYSMTFADQLFFAKNITSWNERLPGINSIPIKQWFSTFFRLRHIF
jgi:hypothetical protein